MKIAVCVKHVPEGVKRIDASSKRLDRSGEGALNAFDANAVEEALRLKEAAGGGEVVLVSLGPAKAQDALQSLFMSATWPTVRCSFYAAAAKFVDNGWRPELTEELKAELDRRVTAHEADPTRALTWEQVLAHVRRPR